MHNIHALKFYNLTQFVGMGRSEHVLPTQPLINAQTRPVHGCLHKHTSVSPNTHVHKNNFIYTHALLAMLLLNSNIQKCPSAQSGVSCLTPPWAALDDTGLLSSHKLEPDCQRRRRRHRAFPTEVQMCTYNNEDSLYLRSSVSNQSLLLTFFFVWGSERTCIPFSPGHGPAHASEKSSGII